MRVRFWGVRGSIPTPASGQEVEEKIVRALLGASDVDLSNEAAVRRYVGNLPVPDRGVWGGNTTCVEIRTQEGDLVIIDAGSGLRALGEALLDTEFGRGEGHAAMLFTHTHWDHIQGFPFFKPLFIAGNRFDIYARHDSIQARLDYQHDFRFFPVGMDVMAATKSFYDMPETIELFDGRVVVRSLPLDHPGVAYAYRVEADGHAFIMASDGEYHHGKDPAAWERFVGFYAGADVLVFDAQYTLKDEVLEKENWGHSNAVTGTEMAVDAGVDTLVLFHHEPSYDDQAIQKAYDEAIRCLDLRPGTRRPRVLVAREGLELDLAAGSSHLRAI